MEVPRALWISLGVGLGLLALSGVFGAVHGGLQEQYYEDCSGYPRTTDPNAANATTKPEAPTFTPDERVACREQRVPVTTMDALLRGTLGPGITLVALSGVYLIAAAIGGRPENQP